MKRLFVLFVLFLPLFVFAQIEPPQPSTYEVTVKDWYETLNTTFYWSEYNLPETTAIDRARAMNLSQSGPEEMDNQLTGWTIYFSLSDLFFSSLTNNTYSIEDGWYLVKLSLLNKYQINLDSVEAKARNLNKFSIGLRDYLSKETLNYFSIMARKTPIGILQAITATSDDERPASFIIRQDGKSKISAFLSRFNTWHKISSHSIQVDWHTDLISNHQEGSSFWSHSFGVIRFDGKYSIDTSWIPMNSFVSTGSYMNGCYRVAQDHHSGQWTDNSGLDHTTWSPSVIWRVYPRGDINRSFGLSFGDAISGANMLLDGNLPSIPNLMDITKDGSSDHNDLLAIYQAALYGWWGGGKGKTTGEKDSIKKQIPSGVLVVEKFNRNDKPMVRLIFEGLPGKSLGLVLEKAKTICFSGDYLKSLSTSKEVENSIRVLRFAEKPSAEILLEAEVFGEVVAKPLNGKYFFTPNEDIKIVYRNSSPTSVIENPIPSDFGLNQNYPNPFNPETVISFNLPEVSRVRLGVYNTLGELIATLADGEFSAGQHALPFDGSRLASGIYFYRLETNQFSKTMKMVLSK